VVGAPCRSDFLRPDFPSLLTRNTIMPQRVAPNAGLLASARAAAATAQGEEAATKPSAAAAGKVRRPQTARARSGAAGASAATSGGGAAGGLADLAMKPALMATMLAAKSFAATSSAGIKPAKRPGSAAVAVAKRSGATAGPAVAWPWRSVLETSSAELASLSERLRLCLSARDEMAKALGETEKRCPTPSRRITT
jgi:hypothetical protein